MRFKTCTVCSTNYYGGSNSIYCIECKLDRPRKPYKPATVKLLDQLKIVASLLPNAESQVMIEMWIEERLNEIRKA